MAFTSNDETDLILPLLQMRPENGLFATFLERLLRRTQAAQAGFAYRFSATATPCAQVHPPAPTPNWPLGLDRARLEALRAGRVYALDEMLDAGAAERRDMLRSIRANGIEDARIVRTVDDTGHEAWFHLARREACSAADSALLTGLLPYLAAALRGLAERTQLAENSAFEERISSYTGRHWVVLDDHARITHTMPQTLRNTTQDTALLIKPGERLRGISPAAAEIIQEFAGCNAVPASKDLQENSAGAVRAVALGDPAGQEALLIHAAQGKTIVLFSMKGADETQCALRLREIYDLPPREAQLAARLANGESIVAAGRALGLSAETARNYSKRIYARISVSGQPALCARIWAGIAMLG